MYPFQNIEPKWQAYWDKNKTFKAVEDESIPKEKRRYVLDMFPYPSGAGLHVGHPATMFFIRWDTMHSVFLPKTMQSKQAHTLQLQQTQTSSTLLSRLRPSVSLMTGTAKSVHVHRITTNGLSGFSSSSLRRAWLTKHRLQSTGARAA